MGQDTGRGPATSRDDDGATQGLTSAGSLSSGSEGRSWSRRRKAVVVACCTVLVLVGLGVAVQRHGAGHPATAAAASSAAASSRAPASRAAAPPPVVSMAGRDGFAIDSAGVSARIRVTSAARVPADPFPSPLELALHVDVRSGVEQLTTEAFVVTDEVAGTTTRASGLTVLRPGPQIVPFEEGFRIPAPASVDVLVFVAVPAGQQVVSVVAGPGGPVVGSFQISG
jgi:hypothetical protein